ncbi:hypothetical protein KP509_07G076400 [Ceratopteris richardii]|uniref:Uncharacterized protein n=1 Tax=Ceratopteris richardii TaxID=49495 RepID=A0A8T2UJB7_CERRI|nr:hypothetical protein KP509_07G076400 [Ceratopteris richardii]
MDKIEEKLHIGGHKEDANHAHATAGLDGGHGAQANHGQYVQSAGKYGEHGHVAGPEGHGANAYGAKDAHTGHQEGPLEKIKNKVKGKKGGAAGHGEDGSSSSSSESDGEGGRRICLVVQKKKHGIF